MQHPSHPDVHVYQADDGSIFHVHVDSLTLCSGSLDACSRKTDPTSSDRHTEHLLQDNSSSHPAQSVDDSLTLKDENERVSSAEVLPRPVATDYTTRIQPKSWNNMSIKQEPEELDVPSADEELNNVLMVEQILKSMYTNHASRTGDGRGAESELPLEIKLQNVMLIENALKQMKREITDLSYIDSALQNVHKNMEESLSFSEDEDGQSSIPEDGNDEVLSNNEQEGSRNCCSNTETSQGGERMDVMKYEESEIKFEDDSQAQATEYEPNTNIPSSDDYNETVAQPDENNENFQKDRNAETFQHDLPTDTLKGSWNTDIFQNSVDNNALQNDFITQTFQDSCSSSVPQEDWSTNTYQNGLSTETSQDGRTTEDLQNCWNTNVTENGSNLVTFHNDNDTESFHFQDTHNSEALQNNWNEDIFQEGQNTEIPFKDFNGMTDIERALLSSPLLVGDDFQATSPSLDAWMASQRDQSQRGVDVARSDGIREVVGEEEEEVTRSAKKLFAKRTKTLFHWLHPSDSKSELKERVDHAWEQLSQRESEFYYSQVLGPFNHRQVKPMVNPRIFELLGLPASLRPSTTGLPISTSLPLEPPDLAKQRRQSTRHKSKHNSTDASPTAHTDAKPTIDADVEKRAKKRVKRGPYITTLKKLASSDSVETSISKSRNKVGRPKKRRRRWRKGGSDGDSDYHLPGSRQEAVVMDISVELQQCDKILDSDSDW